MTIVDVSVRASRALLVTVGSGGPVIPRYTNEEEIPLDLRALRVITSLCGGPPGVLDKPGVESLLDALRVRGLLTDDDQVSRVVPHDDPLLIDVSTVPHDPDVVLVMFTPVFLRPGARGFDLLRPDGQVALRLTPRELNAIHHFRAPCTTEAAFRLHVENADAARLTAAEFDELTRRARATGLVRAFDPEHPADTREARSFEAFREALSQQHRITLAFDHAVRTADRADLVSARAAARSAKKGGAPARLRPRVVPVDTNWALPPLALGMVVAHARAHKGGMLDQTYRFHPRWFFEEHHLADLAEEPSIFLFSNYFWNHPRQHELSAMVKRINPANITVHGGPNTPKYQGDCEEHFALFSDVDVTVRGEGEATFAELLEALDGRVESDPPDLSALSDVKGLSYRSVDGRIIHTPDRDRIADLDTIPSPLLTGLFDGFAAGPTGSMVLETNRGCPYGCTFCDWGSATLSRIRKFSMERVFGELEWCAKNKIHSVSIADANFGVFERDVEIAEKVAELKATYGFPQMVGTNYAKNTVKHLRRIIEVFAEGGILAEGVVSLQSMDADTLLTIRRKNIKVEKYNELAEEFRRNNLPLAVDLMMGLPGATPEGFRYDIQECINRDVRARVHSTQLLPNSPMNDPAYRLEHGISAVHGEYVHETATFSEVEWQQMNRVARVFIMADMFGLMRQVAKYVRAETEQRELDFYERISDAALDHPERWPLLSVALRALPDVMVPPLSWRLFIDELHDFIVEEMGVADDSALSTALAVQHALLPSGGRTFPEVLTLDHDFAAWHAQLVDAREADRRADWETVVPPLRSFGPATFVVDDPENICVEAMGQPVSVLSFRFASWELGSPVARPRMAIRNADN